MEHEKESRWTVFFVCTKTHSSRGLAGQMSGCGFCGDLLG
jgi:hypothetical protein